MGAPPAKGRPFEGWPPLTTSQGYPERSFAVSDGYMDGVPDMAEYWMLGQNIYRESTDRDKFDDGQELFGTTKWEWGALPRAEDTGYIFAEMPAWVEEPGNHPLCAACPVPEAYVVLSSLHVETVTTIKTDHEITEGTERSYSTSDTTGTSTSVAETETWNSWQEVSTSVSQRQLASLSGYGLRKFGWGKANRGTARIAVGGLGAAAGCIVGGVWAAGLSCYAGIAGLTYAMYDGVADWVDACSPDKAQERIPEMNRPYSVGKEAIEDLPPSLDGDPNMTEVVKNIPVTAESQDLAYSNQGIRYVQSDSGGLEAQSVYELKNALMAPVTTNTETSGQSHGGALTTTHEEYEEHTVTNGEAFSSSESWGDATAVDAAHSADLWFSYEISNVGTEYAVSWAIWPLTCTSATARRLRTRTLWRVMWAVTASSTTSCLTSHTPTPPSAFLSRLKK